MRFLRVTIVRRIALGSLVLFALVASSLSAYAQTRGSVRGVVTAENTSVPIVGARVSVETPRRVGVTDERGVYVLRDLPVGSYSVTATANGRQPVRSDVTITSGETTKLDISMPRGPILLSSVIVSATRTPTNASNVASTVNVLGPVEVATSPARESQDMLREIPGVELPRTSSLVGGTAQIVSIRGVDEGRTAVLFDGIPVNDAWGEWIDWGRVPKGMIDHVEVIEGGTSNLYGNGAMGGVISFFSRPVPPMTGRLLVEGGSRDTRHIGVSAGIPIVNSLTASFDGDFQNGGGYNMFSPSERGRVDEVSGIKQRNGYLRLNYTPQSNFSAFLTGHLFADDRDIGTPLGDQSRYERDLQLGADYGNLGGGTLTLRGWGGMQSELQRSSTVRANSTTCDDPSSDPRQCEDSSIVARIPSHDWGASAIWTRQAVLHLESISFGGDFRRMSGNYDETDFNTSCPGANCGNVSRTIESGGDQTLSGVFAQAIASPIDKLRVELSARVDHWSNDNGHSIDAINGDTTFANRSKNAFSPRLGARYQIIKGLAIRGALYEAFRAPNLAELYRKQISGTSITIPNPDLSPEHAFGREIGADWQPAEWIQLKGTWYVADYKDFNVPVQISAGPPAIRQRLNVSKSRSKGGEAYLALHPIQQMLVSGSVNYDQDRIVSGPAGTVVGAPVNRVPSPRQTIRASYLSPKFGDYTAIWRHEGHTTTLQGIDLAPFSVLDLNAQRLVVPGVRAIVSLENVTDKQYQVNIAGAGASELISYGLPRTFRLGIEVFRN
ncbi:MAG TPA: TonB-dependent receptor [Gemmatimonadaceae bacterium]|nr:TonB-dependent receptor [Gemmatimonadaceae bacterium]